jgi:hypothetical protein
MHGAAEVATAPALPQGIHDQRYFRMHGWRQAPINAAYSQPDFLNL